MFGLIFLIIITNNVFKERFKNKMLNDLSQNNFNIYKFVKN